MRVLPAVLSASTASLVWAALEAPVYFLDKVPKPSISGNEIPSTSPQTARLLLAQRLGLSEYHSLKDADDKSLEVLNTLRGHQTPLFQSKSGNNDLRRLLVIVSSVHKPDEIFDAPLSPTFRISNPPESSSTIQLVTDLLNQDKHRRRAINTCGNEIAEKFTSNSIQGGFSGSDPSGSCLLQKPASTAYNVTLAVEELDILKASAWWTLGGPYLADSTAIFHVNTLQTIARRDGEGSAGYQEVMQKLKQVLQGLAQATDAQESTFVFMPMTSRHAKRDANAYGTYDMPANLAAREHPVEAPLSAPSSPEASSSTVQGSTPSQPQVLQASSIVKTTMPICHSAQSSCMSATNNCSGHGECFKKYTDKSTPDQKGAECWACGCKGTVVTNANGGIKTTYWGGPACQKKDVSVPFFLLSGFTIVIVTIVAGAIGMIYSIGQETLPSVIGAGVAGPKASK